MQFREPRQIALEEDKMRMRDFLLRLEKVTRTGQGYMACCPAHDDHVQSLSTRESDDGKILLKCHAGCQTELILEKIGLAWSDLFPEVRS